MRSESARRPRLRRPGTRSVVTVSAVGALLLAVALVWQSAAAGFTDTTTSLRPTVGTGTLTLADDDAEARLFTVAGLKPGESAGTRCITVRTGGTARADVRLYVTGLSGTRALDDWITVTVRIGTGGSTASCTGYRNLATVYTGALGSFPADSWAAGRQSWVTAAAGEARTYEITASLATNAPASAQGGTATATFVWEAQNP